MPGAETPEFAPCPLHQNRSDPISSSGFELSINFLHLVRKSALLKSHFVKSSVVGPSSRPSSTATGFPATPFRLDLGISTEHRAHIHQANSVSVELSLLLLLPLLSAA